MRSVFMGRGTAAPAVAESMGCSCNALGTRARVKGNQFSMLGALSAASIFLLFVALCALPGWGQATNTGTIIGSVFDNTGAFVPGAKVTITQNTTNAARSTATDKSGRFVFVDVDPGDYAITVTKQGFATTTVTNQTVKIGTQLTENIKLQLGSVSTTVTVTETPGAELQTLTPTVGTTLSGAIILNLPNTSRDASTLAILEPGQNILGNTGGAESDQNSFQLDGGYATDDMSGDNNTYIPSFGSDTAGGTGSMHSAGFNQTPSAVIPIPVASVEEFKVSTANQTADFNGGAGSQMQLVTKRGTSQLHGSVYDYYEDTKFGGANTWDNNLTGTPIVSSHFSRFGASAGGKIPSVNVLGGGWFLFGNYEGYRFPQGETFERNMPTASLRAGLIKLNGEVINLNPKLTTDPGTSNTYAANSATCVSSSGCDIVNNVPTYTQGTVIPCASAKGCDPRGLGINPVITQLWSTYLPMPNDCTHGDGLNYCGYKGSIKTPQTSNFGVVRLDHDFASKWHFNGTYHYYKLVHTVADQWDIGGFFPGDTMGQYSAIRHKPQQPWLYTAGLTTELTPNVTNNARFSFTRNFWAYADPSGVPNVAGYPAALEVGGENSGGGSSPVFIPYNTNNQNVRTRFWDGKDTMIGDDVSWLKGNHLFQLGGSYLRNNDTHNRNDNGGTINTFEQYLIGEGLSTSLAGVGIDMSNYTPPGVSKNRYGDLYSMVLGMVDETQSLYTRGLGSQITGLPLKARNSCAISGIAATAGCVASPPLVNTSILPTYNIYLTDSWHLKPTFSLNYGLGYTVEMPAYETRGGFQTVLVDQNNNIVYAQQYLAAEKTAALQGNAYAPLLGFSAIRNVREHSKYPYDPYYGGISPRIGFAWNVKNDTVIRGGYARIFGRINGVNPILVPMLTPGLMQPATCGGPNLSGGCGGDPTNVFRVGVDGTNAPLPPPSANLPQPWFPGQNDVATGAGETFDPNFHPDRSDEFTFSVQHQFGPKILAEAGYIGRKITNEIQYYSFTNVPYMMTMGGQTFANAWKNVMLATNMGTNLASIPAQPFFEAALNPSYCNIGTGTGQFPNCTAAFVTNNAGNMSISDPFDSWASVSNAGMFNFGRTFQSDPIPATCSTINPAATTTIGCNGQSPSLITTVSNGYGNYNDGYLQLTFQDWHGLTAKTNFSMSKALGTGNVVQASSSFSSVDPFDIAQNYGPQGYDEKFTFNLFLNYAPTWYAGQNGVLGHVLGGWSFSPLFVYGTGFPLEINTQNGDCGTLGECNSSYVGANENGIITAPLHYTPTQKASAGDAKSGCGTAGAGFNVFSNPLASCPVNGGTFGDVVRSPVLGLDGRVGSFPLYGLAFWNLDLGITKKIKVNERMSSSLYFDWTNALNHMQPADPCFNLYDTTTWGVLGCGGNLQLNNPRELQLGLSFDW